MKLTKQQLKQLIKEELQKVLQEQEQQDPMQDPMDYTMDCAYKLLSQAQELINKSCKGMSAVIQQTGGYHETEWSYSLKVAAGVGRSDPKKGYWRPPPKGHPLYGQEGVQCDEDGYCAL